MPPEASPCNRDPDQERREVEKGGLGVGPLGFLFTSTAPREKVECVFKFPFNIFGYQVILSVGQDIKVQGVSKY